MITALLTPFSILLVLSAAFMHASWNALLRGGADRAQSMLIMNVTVGVIGLGDDGLRRAAVGRVCCLCGRLGSHSSGLQRAAGADVSQRRSWRDLSGGAWLIAGAGRARRQPVRRRVDEPDRRCRHRPRLHGYLHAGGRPGALGKTAIGFRLRSRLAESGRPACDEFAGCAWRPAPALPPTPSSMVSACAPPATGSPIPAACSRSFSPCRYGIWRAAGARCSRYRWWKRARRPAAGLISLAGLWRHHLGDADKPDGRGVGAARNQRGIRGLARGRVSRRAPDSFADRGVLHHRPRAACVGWRF